MKATFNGVVVAEAPEEALIRLEGNWYFPASAVTAGLSKSPTPYTCPWKGVCQYWNADVDGTVVKDLAWSYEEPYPSAIERVGSDFTGFVAFDPRVTVTP